MKGNRVEKEKKLRLAAQKKQTHIHTIMNILNR